MINVNFVKYKEIEWIRQREGKKNIQSTLKSNDVNLKITSNKKEKKNNYEAWKCYSSYGRKIILSIDRRSTSSSLSILLLLLLLFKYSFHIKLWNSRIAHYVCACVILRICVCECMCHLFVLKKKNKKIRIHWILIENRVIWDSIVHFILLILYIFVRSIVHCIENIHANIKSRIHRHFILLCKTSMMYSNLPSVRPSVLSVYRSVSLFQFVCICAKQASTNRIF